MLERMAGRRHDTGSVPALERTGMTATGGNDAPGTAQAAASVSAQRVGRMGQSRARVAATDCRQVHPSYKE